MSMVWLWNRIFAKPERVEMEVRAEKQAREPRKAVEGAPPTGTCRVCGHEGPERYCPTCLADTMIVRRRPLRR